MRMFAEVELGPVPDESLGVKLVDLAMHEFR